MNKDKEYWKSAKDDTIVCYCNEVNKESIVSAINNGATDLYTINKETNAGFGKSCKEKNPSGVCCHNDILMLLEIYGNFRISSKCSCCG